jgi:alpha-galactosidase
MKIRTLSLLGVCAASFLSTIFVVAAQEAPQDVAILQQADAPPNGIWIDSLDLTAVQPFLRRGGRGGGNRAGGAPATPPPPPVYALGGVTYPHALPLVSDRDLTIDLKGKAVRFASMVGIDSAVQAGRGSVYFGVWVDGKKVADSGLLKGGDAPKMLTANLTGAKMLTLAVIDGNDGTGNDNANWGGALITMAAGAQERPAIISRPVEAMPPIASAKSVLPLLNYPRITGGSVGKPFMFLIRPLAKSR